MKTEKLKLAELTIHSFVTVVNSTEKNTVQGGGSGAYCNPGSVVLKTADGTNSFEPDNFPPTISVVMSPINVVA